MKTNQTIILLIAALVACASAFSTPSPKTSFKPVVDVKSVESKNVVAAAAFATAMAPFAAFADDIDESAVADAVVDTVAPVAVQAAAVAASSGIDEATVIGYGAGLVACVVSLAVGFTIGYGTLVKP